MQILDFIQQIQFKTCPPEAPIAEGWSSEFELQNTNFGSDDTLIKTRLGSLLSLERMSTLAVAAIINQLVRHLPPQQAYVNIGIWHGFTFLAALQDNPHKYCIGIDNFSETFDLPRAREGFLARFAPYRSAYHQFLELDYRDFFKQPAQVPPIGLYFYDGNHDYQHQLEGLTLAEPFLAPGAIILVDDINWFEPLHASEDFFFSRPEQYQIICRINTCQNAHPSFWNGLLLAQKIR